MKTSPFFIVSARLILAVVATGGVSLRTQAAEILSKYITFEEAWGVVQGESSEIKASQSEASASQVASSRASNHWYPRIFATSRVFSTSDPGANFMYTLEQRQISAQDFVPNSLNHPGSNIFEQAGLGLDFAVYEGGSKVAAARAAELEAQSKRVLKDSTLRQVYARIAKDFALLLSLSEESHQLELLGDDIDRVLAHYSIGLKSNPVGYSGLLGLKNLKNRIQGLLIQNRAQESGHRNDVNSFIPQTSGSEWTSDWSVKPERSEALLVRVLHDLLVDQVKATQAVPAQVHAMRLGAQALDEAKTAEKAVFLPRVGLFARGDLYSGSRDTATQYTGGAYLQWDLLNMQSWGGISEAAYRAEAAQFRTDAVANQLHAQSASSREALKASRDTLKLLDESAELLEEQTKTARELFRNGSINALQLVEVLNRRADLLENRRDAEAAMAEGATQLFLSSGTEDKADL